MRLTGISLRRRRLVLDRAVRLRVRVGMSPYEAPCCAQTWGDGDMSRRLTPAEEGIVCWGRGRTGLALLEIEQGLDLA